MKLYLDGIWRMKSLLAGLLLICSCAEESLVPETIDEGMPLQLSVELDNSAFSSDSEVVPMSSRAEVKPYVVTRIFRNTLFILKKISDTEWVVMEQRDNVLDENGELMDEEPLKLTDAGAQYTLLPGTYQFVLFVNAVISREDILNEIITVPFPLVINSSFSVGDFFFAKSEEIKLEKTTGLDQEKDIRMVSLELKRNSALVRFMMDTDLLAMPEYNSSIFYKIVQNESNKLICNGMDVFGNMVFGSVNMDMNTEIVSLNEYTMNQVNWTFSKANSPAPSPSIYADDQKRCIDLEITAIGNASPYFEYSFEGTHLIKDVPIQRNHITTILIRETGLNMIEHEINPDISSWDPTYPPFNYIELNNK